MSCFYSIQEVSKLTGLSTYTLRYYEKIGLIYDVMRKNKNHIRYYPEKNLDWIHSVIKLKRTGISLVKIKKYVTLIQQGEFSILQRLDVRFCRVVYTFCLK